MSPRLKATRDIDVHGIAIPAGQVFRVRARQENRLVAAGDAEPVNLEGQTGKEAKRSTRARKNATRRK